MVKRLILALFSLLVLVFAPFISLMATATSKGGGYVGITRFQPSKGDYVLADTKYNVGYIFNDVTGFFTSFPILSGQKRKVCYGGSCYHAATPERTWYVKEKNIQTDRYTFGETGEFLRLYYKGDHTKYGIHGVQYFEDMVNSDNRYRSMGCILVADDVLDLIEESYLANENNLKVVSTKNFAPSAIFRVLQ